MSDVSVVIGMPILDNIKMRTVMSLIGITTNTKRSLEVVFVKNSYIHEARRSIVLKAKAVGASHLLFLDSDMNVEADVLEKLLAHNKEIVGINYNTKSIPPLSTVKFKDENGITIAGHITKPNELFECAGVATGCMLINMNVFDIIDKPWFFYEYSETDELTGEDIWFCQQAQKKGIKIWCDPTIKCSHIGEYEY